MRKRFFNTVNFNLPGLFRQTALICLVLSPGIFVVSQLVTAQQLPGPDNAGTTANSPDDPNPTPPPATEIVVKSRPQQLNTPRVPSKNDGSTVKD